MATLKTRPASVSNSWEDVVKHAAPLAFSLLSAIGLTILTYIIFLIVFTVFSAIGGGSHTDLGASLGLFFGSISAIPTYILSALFSVLVYIIPALYFERGEVISFSLVLQVLRENFLRYLLAGVLFGVAFLVGTMFCILPGIAVLATLPIYINKVYNTNMSLPQAFSSSFSAVFQGQGWSFIGIQFLGFIAYMVISVCTCNLVAIVALPILCFYMQNVAYNKGLVS